MNSPVRLMCLLGPSDAGKTTLAEKLGGRIKKFALEEKTGVTMKTGYAAFDHSGVQGYVLDHPGHQALSIEALRSLDLMDVALYVVDCALNKGSAPYGYGLDHYTMVKKLLKSLEVPYILCLNKADSRNMEELQSIYEDYRRKDPGVVAVPVSSKTTHGLSLLLEQLTQIPLRRIARHPGVVARVIKSFNTNPCGIPLSEIHGGVLGYYAYQPLSTQELWHTNAFCQHPMRLRIDSVHMHNDRIGTMETRMDPILAKHDHQKGTLILDYQPPRQSGRTSAILELTMAYVDGELNKGDRLLLLVLGQTVSVVVRRVHKNRVWVSRDKPRGYVHIPPEAHAIVMGFKGKSTRIVGFCPKITSDVALS